MSNIAKANELDFSIEARAKVKTRPETVKVALVTEFNISDARERFQKCGYAGSTLEVGAYIEYTNRGGDAFFICYTPEEIDLI